MTAAELKAALRSVATEERARGAAWYFKTGKGEYGEGDRFLGVTTPDARRIGWSYFKGRSLPPCPATLSVARELLQSSFHEDRSLGLLLLVEQFKKSGEADRQRIFDFYLKHIDRINNWDLVDTSAPYIVGAHLLGREPDILFTMAESEDLWTRRVAVLATAAFIHDGRFGEILRLAERLLIEKGERHDLMHKAVGWMLREAGARDSAVLEAFLDQFAPRMPRTALRYAIEKFAEHKRQKYLRMPRALPQSLRSQKGDTPHQRKQRTGREQRDR